MIGGFRDYYVGEGYTAFGDAADGLLSYRWREVADLTHPNLQGGVVRVRGENFSQITARVRSGLPVNPNPESPSQHVHRNLYATAVWVPATAVEISFFDERYLKSYVTYNHRAKKPGSWETLEKRVRFRSFRVDAPRG